MILDLSEAYKEKRSKRRAKYQAKKVWHRWFAWHPVEVPNGSACYVWLHVIERKWYHENRCSKNGGLFGGPAYYVSSFWSYRFLEEGLE